MIKLPNFFITYFLLMLFKHFCIVTEQPYYLYDIGCLLFIGEIALNIKQLLRNE